MFLPRQPRAPPLAVGVDGANAAFGQVAVGVLRPQLAQDRRIGPDLGEALLAGAGQAARRDAQLDARVHDAVGADQAGGKARRCRCAYRSSGFVARKAYGQLPVHRPSAAAQADARRPCHCRSSAGDTLKTCSYYTPSLSAMSTICWRSAMLRSSNSVFSLTRTPRACSNFTAAQDARQRVPSAHHGVAGRRGRAQQADVHLHRGQRREAIGGLRRDQRAVRLQVQREPQCPRMRRHGEKVAAGQDLAAGQRQPQRTGLG